MVEDATAYTRIYLAVFYSAFAAFYTARVIFMQRATARVLVFPGERFCTTWWNHMTFRLFRVTIWMVCLFRAFFPELDHYIGLIDTFQHPTILLSGVGLLTFGALMTVFIHLRLGKAWRSGIDPNAPAKIITHGFYRLSRNPMFVFVAIAQLGFFLALPSVFSLLCLLIGLYTLHSQIKEEEKHLRIAFPNDYLQYVQRVRRWI